MSSKHPESQCGSDCFAAKLQTGDRKGTYFDLDLPQSGKIQTYFTAPGGVSVEEAKEKKFDKIILWMADIFGPYYNNNCLLMDWHASQGYLVISPDYFHGQQLEKLMEDPSFDKDDFIPQWCKDIDDGTGGKIERTKLLLKEWIPRVKGMFGTEKSTYGIIGFCFGAPYVLDYCCTDEVDAGCIVHPARCDDDEVFSQLRKPLYASLAEQDSHFPPARRHALEKALTALASPEAPDGDTRDEEKVGTGDYQYMIHIFSGVRHGFALRADLSIENNRWAKERSAENVDLWFKRFL